MALTGDREVQIKQLCDELGLWPEVAVETGTWTGETTEALANVFRRVHTIELSLKYHADACHKFADTHIECLLGDSAEIVPHLAMQIHEPVFWYLDAHFWDIPLWSEWAPHREWWASSSPQPLFAELTGILQRSYSDIIVVDDMHAFGAEANWEEITIPRLTEIVQPAKVCSLWDSFAMLRVPDAANIPERP